MNVIGKRIRKVDGFELVTGRAKFAGDYKFPGMVYGAVKRAGVPAGRITSIDVAAARNTPGVIDVLTAKDIPGPNLIGVLPPYDQPLLAENEIRYAGESVVLIIAETAEIARSAASSVSVSIEPYDPILSVEDALAPDARKIHESGNITLSKKLIKGEVKSAFEKADVIVEGVYETSFQDHAYLEPETVCAVPGRRITLYASCQSPFHIRGHVAANLNMPASSVQVVQAVTGGSFGGKDDVAAEIGSLACIAAQRLNRPVMIAHERKESIIGSNLRHAARIDCKTGALNDGTIIAREITVMLDGGAYASESPFVTMKTLIHAAGPYNIENVEVESTAVFTNKTYCGAFRGFGVPQVTFASESQIDELADKLGMDRLEIRRINGLKAGDANATGQVYQQSVGLQETIEVIAAQPALPDRIDVARYLHGTGYACVAQGISNGAEGIDVTGASVQMSQDGSVLVGIGLTELGQGSRTVWAQIVAEVLGVDIENISVRLVDTDSVHDSGPTVASRSTTVGGMAVQKAANEVKKSLVSMAALMMQTDEENIELRDGYAILKMDDAARIPISSVATAAYWTGFPLMNLAFSKAPEANFDDDTHQGDIYIAYNYGTHRMDVQVDTTTGEVKVLNHFAAHDVGRVINPLGLEGQVEGASLIGFGMAHMERIKYADGIIQNANFADYALPSIKDRIPTKSIAVEDHNPTGPFGAKGAGEPPVAAAAAVFANAISDAVGFRFTRLPITREDILDAIQQRGNHG
ncbi:xanthine dehydrogenase family protein [Candidatus Bipolaricaulota bacterium]|jgi:CO/xanthine dehydrogenase Mo-binding subunit|nr:xanthine dehydrogenase family protein [Candidatus Bipolaricaulota bacterium]